MIYGVSLLPGLRLSRKRHLPSRHSLPVSRSSPCLLSHLLSVSQPLELALLSCLPFALLDAVFSNYQCQPHFLPLSPHLPRHAHSPLPAFPSSSAFVPLSSSPCLCLRPPACLLVQLPTTCPLFKSHLIFTSSKRLLMLPPQ